MMNFSFLDISRNFSFNCQVKNKENKGQAKVNTEGGSTKNLVGVSLGLLTYFSSLQKSLTLYQKSKCNAFYTIFDKIKCINIF